ACPRPPSTGTRRAWASPRLRRRPASAGRRRREGAAAVKDYRIAALPGDGIGGEVVAEGIRVVLAAAERFAFRCTFEELPWGSRPFLERGRMMPEDALERLRAFDAIYLGAVGHPDVPDHTTLNGLLLPIRRAFDQYANVRPTVLFPGVATPLAERSRAI